MFWSFCSPKAGQGTSVVAAATALELAERMPSSRVVLVDFGGDQPDLLGVDATERAGIVDWLRADGDVTIDAIDHLLIDVAPGLTLLPSGATQLPNETGVVDPARCAQLVGSFGRDTAVVADVGALSADPLSPGPLLAVSGTHTTVVLRACYLALRRTAELPIEVQSIVEIVEAGRSLTTLDIELVASTAVSAKVRYDPVVARAVDAGLLVRRRPRQLRRAVQRLIDDVERADMSELEGVR